MKHLNRIALGIIIMVIVAALVSAVILIAVLVTKIAVVGPWLLLALIVLALLYGIGFVLEK